MTPTQHIIFITGLASVLFVVTGQPHTRTSTACTNKTAVDDWRAEYFAKNPVTNVEPYVVILGDDIRLPVEDISTNFRKGKWPFGLFKWPENDDGWPEVAYKFGDDKVIKPAVQQAIDHWEEHTCLRFKNIDDQTWQPHIVFLETDLGCFSLIGRVAFMLLGQTIGLARGCQLSVGTIIHEIGHAVGFHHEQSRSDRNNHVTVNLKNMQLLTVFNNFKSITENYGTPYDLYSIMHYGMLSFTSNGGSTLVTKDPYAQGLMGTNRDALSHMDKRTANLMYDCIEKWADACTMPSSVCENYGYLNKDCTCVCPPGTSGSYCENLEQSYTEALKTSLLTENKEITVEGNITSPEYPMPPRNGLKYTVRIVAPACHKVVLLFHDFSTWLRCISESGVSQCCVDGLEIRRDGERSESGEWYCGSEIQPGDIFESEKNVMVLYHTTYNYDSLYFNPTHRGYLATVQFRLDMTC